MNIYGDNGNVLVLSERLRRRGFKSSVVKINIGEKMPSDADIVLAGGGQDKGQLAVMKDLKTKRRQLRDMSADGVVMLVICGMYQLFGHEFRTMGGDVLVGVGIFDLETVGSKKRMIGNIVSKGLYGRLVGFENHSGQTRLNSGQLALGMVSKGYGNNSETSEEGATIKNTFGTYLHGPLLPKNPHFCDELLRRALERRGHNGVLEALNDSLAHKAADIAARRP